MNDSGQKTLSEQLRAAGVGRVEWRVEHPETGSYCIAFTRDNAAFPEHAAAEWLRDFQKRHPAHEFSGFVVNRRIVQNRTDELLNAAADQLEKATAQMAWLKSHALFDCQHCIEADRFSQHVAADELRMWHGMPMCGDCFTDSPDADLPESFEDLPPFDPFTF